MKTKKCEMCCGGSSLDVGPGSFRDFDSDLSYGVPVCGGCGGLGYTVNNPDFKKRAQRIMQLRFKYCPIDRLPPTLAPYRYTYLKDLIREIKDLAKKYGTAKGSYAESVTHGILDGTLEYYRREMEKYLKKIQDYDSNDPIANATRQAMLAYYSGNFTQGHQLFQKAAEQNSTKGSIWHDFAGMILLFERDAEIALPFFQKAVAADPRALHVFHLGQCLYYLKRFSEAKKVLAGIRNKMDYVLYAKEIEELLNKLS